MRRAFQGSFIYRLFFQSLYQQGEETLLEQSFIFKKCRFFYERLRAFAIQSVTAIWAHKLSVSFLKYGLRTVGIILLFLSAYAFLFKRFDFTLFEFFFYTYLFILALFLVVLSNRLRDYYETSRVKEYLFSKEISAD